MSEVKPITPNEVAAAKTDSIPDEVFEAFNELIAMNYSGGRARVEQNDVVIRIMAKMPNLTRADLYKNRWLDVEPAYQKAGWKVAYDKPGYNEFYEAFFLFVRRDG